MIDLLYAKAMASLIVDAGEDEKIIPVKKSFHHLW